MIILDTNVISELFKPSPSPSASAFVRSLRGDELFTTTITRGELFYGLRCIPDGRRKDGLLRKLGLFFEGELAEHVLPYDAAASDAFAMIMAQRRTMGRPIQPPDAMIAGISHSRGATLATRNLRDFEGCGLQLIDPWQ